MERSEEGHYVFMYIIEGDTVDRKDTYIHIYIYMSSPSVLSGWPVHASCNRALLMALLDTNTAGRFGKDECQGEG